MGAAKAPRIGPVEVIYQWHRQKGIGFTLAPNAPGFTDMIGPLPFQLSHEEMETLDDMQWHPEEWFLPVRPPFSHFVAFFLFSGGLSFLCCCKCCQCLRLGFLYLRPRLRTWRKASGA